MVPLYKSKGDKYECASFRDISLLSVVGKVYGRHRKSNVILEESETVY